MSLRSGLTASVVSASLVLLLGALFVFGSIVAALTGPAGYEAFYNLTYPIQPLLFWVWIGALALLMILVTVLPIFGGRDVVRSRGWRFGLLIALVVGIPSLIFAILGWGMRGF